MGLLATQESHNAIADYIASGQADAGNIIAAIGGMIHAAAQVNLSGTADATQ